MPLKSPIFNSIMSKYAPQDNPIGKPLMNQFMTNADTLASQLAKADERPIVKEKPFKGAESITKEYNDLSNDINASKIRFAEGNDYGAFKDIGDGAGISVGAYQFTEKSGQAQALAKALGFKSIHDKGFKEALTTDKGKQAQDKLYNTYTRRPRELGKKYNLDENTIGFLIDTNVNGGLNSVVDTASKMSGGITLENLKKARLKRYDTLIKKNPSKYAKYKKGWYNRVNNW